jgi:hypothetical protein
MRGAGPDAPDRIQALYAALAGPGRDHEAPQVVDVDVVEQEIAPDELRGYRSHVPDHARGTGDEMVAVGPGQGIEDVIVADPAPLDAGPNEQRRQQNQADFFSSLR